VLKLTAYPHLIGRDIGYNCTIMQRRCAVTGRADETGWLSRLGYRAVLSLTGAVDLGQGPILACALCTVFPLLEIFFMIKISRNLLKILKSIESGINLGKLQNKFL
jgi:hypothetical protein